MPGGASLEVEVWDMPWLALGPFLKNVRPPLAIGTVELATGEEVKGCLCEAYASADAEEITHHGGWLAYKATLST